MQRTLTGLIASWILIVGCGVAAAQTSETIRLTNGEWQPYLSKNTPHYGFASHIVTEAFELVGVEVEYGFFPWKRSYKIAKEGMWDGTAVWVDSDERREDFFYSDAVVPSTWGFFHLKDSGFDWDSYEEAAARLDQPVARRWRAPGRRLAEQRRDRRRGIGVQRDAGAPEDLRARARGSARHA